MKVLAVMFICHFIADFLLQSRDMAQKKSSDLLVLIHHVTIQLVVLGVALWPLVGLILAFKVAFLNALVHGVIDWNIWRGYKWWAAYRVKNGIDKHLTLPADGFIVLESRWLYYEDHWFYTTIGLDQLLHGLTLIICAGVFL